MSLRLPASPALELSDADDDDTGSASSADAQEETWSDWVSDGADRQPCRSLFDDSTLSSAAEALAHDKKTHGFDLEAVCARLGLDFHGRIRLINYISKEKPAPAELQSLSGKEPFFTSDEYLRPVLEDDPLLLAPSDDWSDDDDGKPPADLEKRLQSLELKLLETQQEFSEYKALVQKQLDISRLQAAVAETPPAGTSASASPRDDDTHYFQSYGANDIHAVMIQDRVRTASYASFILTNPQLFADAVVLDVGCGTGILSLFAAKAGARRVLAVDASDIADKARAIVKANGFEDVITVLQGKVESVVLPDDIKQVDVIVSEWMGYALLYESMLDSVLHARDRFLKPGAVMAPSQCQMQLALCEGPEIFKERVGFWGDVYGFDLSAMGEEVYDDTIVDVVGPDSMLSEPCTIKDLFLRDIALRQLDFTAPFTLASTAERRTKVHALVLYFDTFFNPTGEPVPPGTRAHVVKEGGGVLAEVWQLGGKPRRASQAARDKEREQVTSFSTGPRSEPTHWKQTLFLLRDPIVVEEGTVVAGTFTCKKSEDNVRELDVEIRYVVKENADAPMPDDAIVQIFKVR